MPFHVHNDRDATSFRLAAVVAEQLRQAITARGQASLVLSGGSSPLTFYAHLSRQPLDWQRVTIVPSDERWVSVSDARSNAGAIREYLLCNRAKRARLISLYMSNRHAAQGGPILDRILATLARPFDVTVLGMGLDGHTASLFPQAADIATLLQADSRCVVPSLDDAEVGRISLSLSCLLDTRNIHFLFFGDDKRSVYERALTPGAVAECPVRGVLHQNDVPYDVYWAA